MTSANTDFIQVVTCAGIGNGAELTEPHNQLSVSVYHSWRGTNRRVWITGAPRDKAHLRSQGKIASGRRLWSPTLRTTTGAPGYLSVFSSERIFLRAYLPQSISSSERIFIRAYLRQCTSRLGRDLGRGAKSLHESFAGGLSCSLLEELGRSFHDANFFGDRRRDPLVQRHAIFFREPLVLCPATSWHKSGAVILGEARAHVLLISCRDPSRPEGPSG